MLPLSLLHERYDTSCRSARGRIDILEMNIRLLADPLQQLEEGGAILESESRSYCRRATSR
jgi:hypothetical protein